MHNLNPMIRLYILLFFLVSCQTTTLLKDVDELEHAICLSSEGKGRIQVSGQKQVFSFKTFYDEDNLELDIDFSFPIYGTESVSIEYVGGRTRFKIDSSFERRILREQSDVNPELIDEFLTLWAEFFEDLLVSKKLVETDKGVMFKWDKTSKTLFANSLISKHEAFVEFHYLSKENFFERMDMKVVENNSSSQVALELIVRKCLERPTKKIN